MSSASTSSSAKAPKQTSQPWSRLRTTPALSKASAGRRVTRLGRLRNVRSLGYENVSRRPPVQAARPRPQLVIELCNDDAGPEQENVEALPVQGLPVGSVRTDEHGAGMLHGLSDQRGDASVRPLAQLRHGEHWGHRTNVWRRGSWATNQSA